MKDTKTSNNTLHKTKHTRSSVPSYRVVLDPVAISYLTVGLKRPAKFLVRSYLSTQHITKCPPSKKLHSEVLRQSFRMVASLSIPYALVLFIAYVLRTFTDVKVIKLPPRLQIMGNSRTLTSLTFNKKVNLSAASVNH